MFKKTSLALIAAATAMTALPTAAEARHRYNYGYSGYYGNPYRHGYYGSPSRYNRRYYPSNYYYGRNYNYYGRNRYYRDRCRNGTTGAIIGAVAGGLLGREVARSGSRYRYRRGSGTTGAIIGAGAGALIGREIARNC